MVFQEILLFCRPHLGQGLELPEMRPLMGIESLDLVVAALHEQGTHGDMHEVLLLFFGEFLLRSAQLLYADQEKYRLHIGLFPETQLQFPFQILPSGGYIRLQIHVQIYRGSHCK